VSGISSAIGTIAFGRQTAKGTPAAVPTIKFKLAAAPSIGPVKNRNRYVVTDVGRDQGPGYTSGMMISGDIPIYLEPQGVAPLFFGALGANADGGVNPNYTHTATPANDLPYFTIWRMVGNVIVEQFNDCKISSLRIDGSAGQALSATLSVVGLSSSLITTDTVLAALDPGGYLFPEGSGALKIDTVAQPLHQFSLEINNNANPYQADDFFFRDVDPGKREVNFSFGLRFQGPTAEPKYQDFYYGSGGLPRTLTPVVGQHAIDMTFTRSANTLIQFLMPQVEYVAVPVNADPGGDPIDVAVSCYVEKPSGGNIMSVLTKDQVATA
jgi:hypothetical protein